jgi:hypothetical protein
LKAVALRQPFLVPNGEGLEKGGRSVSKLSLWNQFYEEKKKPEPDYPDSCPVVHDVPIMQKG